MISISITADTADTQAYLVRVSGHLKNRRELNAALGTRLATELQTHFTARNAEPNKLGGQKTNFWNTVSENTLVSEVSETGATVSIGSNSHFRIHLMGGTIKPTGGRKWLTIPLITEAHGLRVAEYEKRSGHKLFRLPGTRVLVERSEEDGNRSLLAGQKVSIRRKDNTFGKANIRARSKIRTVFALATEAHIKKDPRALPPQPQLLTALNDAAAAWLNRNTQ